jgi:predicted RNase H-like nuclease (RuvC/YqgF family)
LLQLNEKVEGENQRLSETVINLQSQVRGLQDASKKSDAVNESLQQKLAAATEEIGKFSLKDERYTKATLDAIELRERMAQVEGELKELNMLTSLHQVLTPISILNIIT